MQVICMNERKNHSQDDRKGAPLQWTKARGQGDRKGTPLQWTRIFRIAFILVPLMVLLSACAPGSGIFAGGTWQSSGLQHQHIRTLAVDPNNVQDIYAGDAENGVFVSTDAGAHWSQHSAGLPLPTAIHALAFDDPGKKLYAATDAGVFVSADAAQHWTAIGGLPAGSFTALAFDLNNSHTIYAGTRHHGVFISTNDGASWSAANGGLPVEIEINGLTFDSTQHQLWAATNLGIYRSVDAGSTWQALNTGLPAAIVVNTVYPAAISGGDQRLVFAGTNRGFFRSQDAGAHWSMSQESLAGTNVYAILLDYSKVTTVYVAIGIGVLRSEDNGQDWGGIATGLPRGQPVYALAFGANGFSQLYAAANDVYLYPGSSGGFDFSRLLPLVLFAVFFYVLYRLSRRGRGRRREMLKPERIIEAPANAQNGAHTPVPPQPEVRNEDRREEDV
jgi:photosystem II stability/assembly factor-like uncharacterized protein